MDSKGHVWLPGSIKATLLHLAVLTPEPLYFPPAMARFSFPISTIFHSLLNSLAIRYSGPWPPKPTLTKVPVCQIQVPASSPCWAGLQIQMPLLPPPPPCGARSSDPPSLSNSRLNNQHRAADSTHSTRVSNRHLKLHLRQAKYMISPPNLFVSAFLSSVNK